MSNEAEGHFPHPLLPMFLSWAENSDPMVPFVPQFDFERHLDLLVLADPRIGDEEAKRQVIKTYRYTAAAIPVFASGSHLAGMDLHAMLFHAAQAHPLAFAFCDAAGYALQLGHLPTFAVATHLPGFVEALIDWAKHFEYEKQFNGQEQLMWVNRELVQPEKPGAEFWLDACRRDFDSPKAFMAAHALDTKKYDDAVRKATERKEKKLKEGKNPRPPAKFKDDIAFGWVPLSLWAHTSKGIVHFLDPKGADGQDRVKRDISELEFSGSHRGDLESFIDKAAQYQGKII